MNRQIYRLRWLRLHRSYEKRVYRIFNKAIREAIKVPWEQLDYGNYKTLLDINISDGSIEKAYYDSYLLIGTLHGRKIGKGINRDAKAFIPESFTDFFRNFISQWLTFNGGTKIISVRQNLIDYLIQEIQKGIQNQLTIREIAKEMQKLVNSRTFYRWQALRIARTETTAAANFGALVAGEQSGVVLVKEWISASDARVRRRPQDKYDHVELDGKRIGQNELFNDQGSLLRFPGDPKGQAGSVINCRCTVALVPKRDSEGNLVFL